MLTWGEGVKNPENLFDVICERPLSFLSPFGQIGHGVAFLRKGPDPAFRDSTPTLIYTWRPWIGLFC